MQQYMGYKYCPHCECIYPILVFGKNKQQKDGYWCYCKFCEKERNNKWSNSEKGME